MPINTNYVVKNNTSTGNLYGVKFSGTDSADPLIFANIIEHTSNGDYIGIASLGSDQFDVNSNTMSNVYKAISINDSGNSLSVVNNNLLGAGEYGLELVNTNDNLTFSRNCFNLMPNVSSVYDVICTSALSDEFSIGAIQAVEFPDGYEGPDNCFQEASKDIAKDNSANVPINSFQYGRDPAYSNPMNPGDDCRVPRTNSLVFSFLESDFSHPGCSPHNSPPPGIYIPPTFCQVPSTKSGVNAEIITLLGEIAYLNSLSNPSFADINRVRKLKRCLVMNKSALASLYIEDKDFNGLCQRFQDENCEFTKVSIISKLIKTKKENEARTFLNCNNDNNPDWIEYVKSQYILLDFLEHFQNYSLSQSDKDFLIFAGNKTNYYSPFIRGVYAEVLMESISMPHLFRTGTTRKLNGKEHFKESLLTIFPNPTSNNVVFDSQIYNISEINIYDLTKVNVKKITPIDQKSISIEISDLNRGIYFSIIKLSNGELIIKKLIVE